MAPQPLRPVQDQARSRTGSPKIQLNKKVAEHDLQARYKENQKSKIMPTQKAPSAKRSGPVITT